MQKTSRFITAVAIARMVDDVETVAVPSVGGRPARPVSKREIAEIIEPRVEEIFDLVLREIRRSGYEGKLAAGVVITGGTSILKGMPDVAEVILDLPGRRGVLPAKRGRVCGTWSTAPCIPRSWG